MVFALKLKRLSCFKIRSYFWFFSRYGSTNTCYFPKKYKMHLGILCPWRDGYLLHYNLAEYLRHALSRSGLVFYALRQSDWSKSLFYFQTSFTPLAFFKRTRLITRKHIKPHFNANFHFHYHDFFSFVQFRSKGYPQLHLSTLTGASWSPSVPVKCSAGSFWRPTAWMDLKIPQSAETQKTHNNES